MNFNIQQFKREVNLYRLGIGDMSSHMRDILDILNSKLSNLNMYEYDTTLLFSNKEDNILVTYNTEENFIQADSDNIYSLLRDIDWLTHDDVKRIIGWWLDLNIDYSSVILMVVNFSNITTSLYLKLF